MIIYPFVFASKFCTRNLRGNLWIAHDSTSWIASGVALAKTES